MTWIDPVFPAPVTALIDVDDKTVKEAAGCPLK